jgi:hypothetical protein
MLLTLSALALVTLQTPPVPASDSAASPEQALLARPVVIGASASAGYGVDDEVGAHVSLADALQRTIRAPHAEVVDAASSLIFLDPLGTGEGRIERALEAEPTVVFAIDFLFWFTYGSLPDAERPDLLERGLALLDRLPCTVVIGDVPDMRASVGKMLAHSQVPSPESLVVLNARIQEWAAERERVVLVSLTDFLGRMKADERIEVRTQVWEEGASRGLLQEDELHPTLEGLAALALLCADALVEAREDISTDSFDWDAAAIARSVHESKEAERQEKAERARRREERKRAPEKTPVEEPSGGGDGEAALR